MPCFHSCSPVRNGHRLCKGRVHTSGLLLTLGGPPYARTQTGSQTLEMPAPRLAVASGLSGQADNPSFEAASPDPLSWSRWQASYYCDACLLTSGVQTCLLGAVCPVACAMLISKLRTQQSEIPPASEQSNQNQPNTTHPPVPSPKTQQPSTVTSRSETYQVSATSFNGDISKWDASSERSIL